MPQKIRNDFGDRGAEYVPARKFDGPLVASCSQQFGLYELTMPESLEDGAKSK